MYSSQEIINYPTQLHLVGHFRILFPEARKREYETSGNISVTKYKNKTKIQN
jgi:hypothetical protein